MSIQRGRRNLAFWLTCVVAVGLASAVGVYVYRTFYAPNLDIDGSSELDDEQPYSWPQWLGPARNGVSDESGLLPVWPAEGPPLVWESELGPGYSSMAIARGRLVTMTRLERQEVVVCLDAESGELVWRRAYPCDYGHMDSRYNQGPRAAPAIDGDRVHTVGATGIFACWNLRDGTLLWKHDLPAEFEAKPLFWGVSFAPLVTGDLVFANPGGVKGSLAAFNKMTGELVWRAGTDPASYSSPVLVHCAGRDQLLCFTEKGLLSVAPADGTVLWSYPWTTSHGLNIAIPLLIDGDIFITSGYGVGCARLRVTADDSGNLTAAPVYQTQHLSNQFLNSVHHDGHIYGFSDYSGPLVCLDYATGKSRWKERVPKGSLLVADGKLILLREDGVLALLKPNPKEYEEISSFQYSTGDKCWAAPALAGGRLYVRDGAKLTCFDLRTR